MSTTIRLKKTGRKGQNTFRIVVTDKANSRDGKPLEELGSYNPHTDELNIDTARADYWKEKGAVPSPRAKKLLKWAIEGIPVKPDKPKKAKPQPEAEQPADEAQAETAASTEAAEGAAESAEAEAPETEAAEAAVPEAEAEAESPEAPEVAEETEEEK